MGSGIGTILASIGIPMLVDAITGKGLQVDSNQRRSRRSLPVHTPNTTITKDGGLLLPMNYRSDPFFGTWDQMNNPMLGYGKPKKKKPKKGEGFLTEMLGIPQSKTWNKVPLLGAIF